MACGLRTQIFRSRTANGNEYQVNMNSSSKMNAELTNWSKSSRSKCFVYKVSDMEGIAGVLAIARKEHLPVIPHGAGHSYTDAALNTNGMVIDTTAMRQIISWDPSSGVMEVEPGVTLREMVRIASKDGWWPFVSPSTAEITIGGCVAMNVNDRNSWQNGSFGAHVLSLDVLLVTGELCTIVQERDAQLFRAFVGSLGLLGIIISIRLQLKRIHSSLVAVRTRSFASLADAISMFTEEQERSELIEAWLDGFASGAQLGRGKITCANLMNSGEATDFKSPRVGISSRVETQLVGAAASLLQPVLEPAVQLGNRAHYWLGKWSHETNRREALFPFTYWPSSAIAGYHRLFPQGVETFQAFVPRQNAVQIFTQVLRYSQQQDCMPVWSVMKQHQRDPFLLSYQVDGFSLELNYQRSSQPADKWEGVLQRMIAIVIEAGGRFYLAKDHFMTHTQYRQSMGDEAVETFLRLKQRYDPETLLQSDLFRRVFLSASL